MTVNHSCNGLNEIGQKQAGSMTMEYSVSRSRTGGSQHVPRIWLVDYRYLHVNRTEKTFFIFDLLKIIRIGIIKYSLPVNIR